MSRNLPTAVKTVQVRSAFTPPVEIDVAQAMGPGKTDTPQAKLMARLQPAVELRGGIGNHVVAPHGDPGPDAWKLNVGLLLGAVFVAGMLTAMALFGVRRLKSAA